MKLKRRNNENVKQIVTQMQECVDSEKKCKLHYSQEKLTDWNSSRGETQYYIQKVEIIN